MASFFIFALLNYYYCNSIFFRMEGLHLSLWLEIMSFYIKIIFNFMGILIQYIFFSFNLDNMFSLTSSISYFHFNLFSFYFHLSFTFMNQQKESNHNLMNFKIAKDQKRTFYYDWFHYLLNSFIINARNLYDFNLVIIEINFITSIANFILPQFIWEVLNLSKTLINQ